MIRAIGCGVSCWASSHRHPAVEGTPPPACVLLDHTGELTDFDDTAAFVTALDLVISVNAAVVHLAGRRGAQIRKSFRHLLAMAAGAKRQSVVSIRKIVRSARSGDWDSLYSRSPQLLEEPIAKFFEPIESAHAAFGVPLFDSNADRPTLRNWAANKGEDSLAAYLREKNIRGIDGFGTGIAADAPSMADGLR